MMVLPILEMQSVESIFMPIDVAYKLQLFLEIQRHVDGFPDCSERASGLEWQLWSATTCKMAQKIGYEKVWVIA